MVVPLTAVKFWRVVEPVTKSAPVESTLKRVVPAAFLKFRKFPAKPVVEEATIRFPVVVVAKIPKRALVPRSVVAPRPREVVP